MPPAPQLRALWARGLFILPLGRGVTAARRLSLFRTARYARRALATMRLDRGFTAARRQASRLAGVVRLSRFLHGKGRHSATGLMANNQPSVDSIPHWAFSYKKADIFSSMSAFFIIKKFVWHSRPQDMSSYQPMENKNHFVYRCCKNTLAAPEPPNPHSFVSAPRQPRGSSAAISNRGKARPFW